MKKVRLALVVDQNSGRQAIRPCTVVIGCLLGLDVMSLSIGEIEANDLSMRECCYNVWREGAPTRNIVAALL